MRAHHETTGPEIWEQSGGRVDAWVAAVGTGATFLGVAAALRESNPRVLCAAVEPIGCQPLAGLPVEKPRHLLQGTSYGSVPPHWDASLMDMSLPVTDDMWNTGSSYWRHGKACMSAIRPLPMSVRHLLCCGLGGCPSMQSSPPSFVTRV